MAQELMNRCLTLEAAQVLEVAAQSDEERMVLEPRHQSVEKRMSSIPVASEPSFIYQEGHEEAEGVGPCIPQPSDDPCQVTTSSGESAITPDTQATLASWPWASMVVTPHAHPTPQSTWGHVLWLGHTSTHS